MKWVILALGIMANASASILVKLAIIHPRKFPSFEDPVGALENWPFWLSLVMYGAAFLLYSISISFLPMNVAHPVLTSGAIAVVALSSVLIFGEPFYWTTGVGITFIVAGVVLITGNGAG